MAYSTVNEVLEIGRISFEDIPQSEIERGMLEAETEIDLRIPPIGAGEPGADRYERRYPLIVQSHAHLTLHYCYKRLSYDTMAHAEPGDPFGTVDMNFGAKTPEINTIADYYRKLSADYRELAESLLKKCIVRVPTVRRPQALEI